MVKQQPSRWSFFCSYESVWEHLKLAPFPTILFTLIEYAALKNISNNFAVAKTVGFYVMVAIIPAIFYTYTAFTGESIFAMKLKDPITEQYGIPKLTMLI